MKAIELNQYLNGLVDGLPEETVDRVIYGDPNIEVEGIAVAWMPYVETLNAARANKANVLVTHEPTFYDHLDLDGQGLRFPEIELKKQHIDSLDITIIRCHDVWDAMPEIGIPFAWGKFLGLGDPVDGKRFYNLYSVDSQAAFEFAKKVAGKTATLGQPTIGFYGDSDAEINIVGVGTGCISNPITLYELGADVAISVDDVVRAWIVGEWCHDYGKPLLVVNHCVSEEPGMGSLTAYLKQIFPDIPISHIHQGCTYQSFTGTAEDG